jgi:ubiquinone/menaquinone biosynthesis C-methylase UbiE
MSFKDHFSTQSEAYRRYRPGYPAGLIEWIAAQAPDLRLAVDCATGNGQAALALADHFDTVLALDGSLSQLERASPHARVAYAAAVAERLPVRDASVSLVAAAQAFHWFDFERFHAECRRVLVPDGVVAVWTYEMFRTAPPAGIVIDHFYAEVVGPYWPPERRYVEDAYRTLPFPWREERAPEFVLETDWDLDQVLGYVATWSAVQRYRAALGRDPLPSLQAALAKAWPSGELRRLRWPIHIRLGRA